MIQKIWMVIFKYKFYSTNYLRIFVGIPLDGAALLRSAVKLQTSSPARSFTVTKSNKYDADFDGVPSKLFVSSCYYGLITFILIYQCLKIWTEFQ